MKILSKLNPSATGIELIDGFEYYNLRDTNDLNSHEFWRFVKQNSSTGRVNFILDNDIDISCLDILRSKDYHAWFIYSNLDAKTLQMKKSIKSSDIRIDEKNYSEITKREKKLIKKYWLSQYLDLNLEIFNSAEYEVYFNAIDTTLSEGQHLLFYDGDELVGHASFVEDFNEVLKLENYYVHIWTNQLCSKEMRRRVVVNFFNYLSKLSLPITAGISVSNKKSINLFSANNFKPLSMSVRFYN